MDRKQIREVLKQVEEQGWRVEDKTDGWMVFPPLDGRAGTTPVMIHKTPSDRRAWQNVLAALRRSGFRQKGR